MTDTDPCSALTSLFLACRRAIWKILRLYGRRRRGHWCTVRRGDRHRPGPGLGHGDASTDYLPHDGVRPHMAMRVDAFSTT